VSDEHAGLMAEFVQEIDRLRAEVKELRAEIKLLRSVAGFVEVTTFRDVTKDLPRAEPNG